MQDQPVREKDHLLALKVMRLTKPSIKPLLHVTSEKHDLPGDLFDNILKNNVGALKGAEEFSSGEILSLPQTFGSIYLGETFSCYISILNDSNQNCNGVSLKTDMQTTSQRFQLSSSKPKDVLSPDQSLDDVINYEVKELGTHILICAVTYSSTKAEKLYMRRFYKFQVLKPLEVKTKFYNAQNDIVFLEAQVQNITTSPLCMERVTLESSNFYNVQSLNEAPIKNSGETQEIFGVSYMNPMDTRQYLYKLIPKVELIKELRAKPLSPIGKIDIVWKTNFGETGRLQTSQLQRTSPPERDVKLVLQEAPDVVSLEKQFIIKCKLENSSSSKIEAKLFLANPPNNVLLWCGVSGKMLGPLPPDSYLDIKLHLIAIKPGLHMDIDDKLNNYYTKMKRYFHSHGRVKDFVGHSAKHVQTSYLTRTTHYAAPLFSGQELQCIAKSIPVCVYTDPIGKGLVHSVGWNCNGRHLASCSFDKTVSIFTLEKDRLHLSNTMKGHSDSVDQLCWHPSNPNLLVTASCDKTVRVWDSRGSSSKCIDVITTKGENINICWSADGKTIAVGNKEDLITFIDTKTFKITAEEQFKFEVNEISWNNTNDLFFLTNGHGCINILSYPDLKQVQTLNAHPANCICVKFDPKGRYFATGSADALVSLWDLNELCCVRCFSRLDWPVRTLSFSYDGKLLASASEDLFIDIAMVETGEQVCEISCTTPTFTVAWHPNEYLLAFACDDKDKHHDRDAGTVKLFGLQSS